MTKKNVIANMMPQECLFSEQTHKIIVGIVQDSLMGAYFLTSPNVLVPEGKWNNLAVSAFKYFDRSFPFKQKKNQLDWFTDVKNRAMSFNQEYLSGKTLFSVVFPSDFQFLYMRPDDNVEIKNGILVSGTLNAEVLYKGNNSIIQTYVRAYGPYLGAELISNISRLCQGYISQLGFSVGMQDCLKPELEEQIKLKITEKVEKARKKSEQVEIHPILEARKEQDIFATLNENLKSELASLIFSQKETIKIQPYDMVSFVFINGKKEYYTGNNVSHIEINFKNKELTLFSENVRKFSTNALSHILIEGEDTKIYPIKKQEDAFTSMLTAGAKGEKTQLSQIYGAIGQTVFSGQRIPFSMAGNTKVLPHFVSNDKDPIARGFSSSSYVSGMNPIELYMNFIQSREPQTDTTTKTARTGYVQRKLAKFMSDLVTRKDGSVQTEKNRVVSFQYGVWGSSMDKVVDVDGEAQFSNIKQRYNEVRSIPETSKRAYVFVLEKVSDAESVFISGYQFFERRMKFYREWVERINRKTLDEWLNKKNKITTDTVYEAENLFNIDELKDDIKQFDNRKLEIPDLVKKWKFELMVTNTIYFMPQFKQEILSLYTELKMKKMENLFIPTLSYTRKDLYVYVPASTPNDIVENLKYVFDIVFVGSPDEIPQLPQVEIIVFTNPNFVVEGSDDRLFGNKPGNYNNLFEVVYKGERGGFVKMDSKEVADLPYKNKTEKKQSWDSIRTKSQTMIRTEIL